VYGSGCETVRGMAGTLSHSVASDLDDLYAKTFKDGVTCDDTSVLQCENMVKVNTLLADLKNALSSNSRTVCLWLLYMNYVDILKCVLCMPSKSHLFNTDCTAFF
jgi:hypothetical protein